MGNVIRGPFDSDQAALQQRADLNSQGSLDLEWLLHQQLNPKPTPGNRILEIGCGTGKQTRYMLDGNPFLNILTADAAPPPHNFPAVHLQLDMDQLQFNPDCFDLIYSVYAIYYSKDLPALVRQMMRWVRKGGQIVLMGPGAGTNQELIDLAAGCGAHLSDVQSFFPSELFDSLCDKCKAWDIQRRTDRNAVPMNRERLLAWWRNHNSYAADVEQAVLPRIDEIAVLTKVVDTVVFNRLW